MVYYKQDLQMFYNFKYTNRKRLLALFLLGDENCKCFPSKSSYNCRYLHEMIYVAFLQNKNFVDLEDKKWMMSEMVDYDSILGFRFFLEHDVSINFGMTRAVQNGNLEMLKFAINHGGNINYDNGVLLTIACGRGHLDIVHFLYQNNIKHPYTDNSRHPLLCVCMHSGPGTLDVLKYLIQREEFPGVIKYKALRCSIVYKQIEKVKYLIENGADVQYQIQTAIKVATKNNDIPMVEYFKSLPQ